MKKGEIIKIYERTYDEPKQKDGSDKPNKFLGEFKIEKVIAEGFYSGRWIGRKNGKRYFISEIEITSLDSPLNAGSRLVVDLID